MLTIFTEMLSNEHAYIPIARLLVETSVVLFINNSVVPVFFEVETVSVLNCRR